jgi:hypothetical protein
MQSEVILADGALLYRVSRVECVAMPCNKSQPKGINQNNRMCDVRKQTPWVSNRGKTQEPNQTHRGCVDKRTQCRHCSC